MSLLEIKEQDDIDSKALSKVNCLRKTYMLSDADNIRTGTHSYSPSLLHSAETPVRG